MTINKHILFSYLVGSLMDEKLFSIAEQLLKDTRATIKKKQALKQVEKSLAERFPKDDGFNTALRKPF